MNSSKLDFKGPLPKEVAQAVLDVIREDTSKGIGFKDGKPVNFPKGVDLRDSGELMDSAKALPGGLVTFPAKHASVVNSKYPFAEGLSEDQKKRVLAKCKGSIVANIQKRSV